MLGWLFMRLAQLLVDLQRKLLRGQFSYTFPNRVGLRIPAAVRMACMAIIHRRDWFIRVAAKRGKA
jgi:hypothetical protein